MKLNEPTTLKVRLTSVFIDKEIKPFKVMTTGDWHISPIVSERQFEFIQTAISKAEPDVILLQGDLVDSPLELKRETSLKRLAKTLRLCAKSAPTAMVLGSHDFITPTRPPKVMKDFALTAWEKICKKAGVKLLIDDYFEPVPDLRVFGAFQDEKCCVKKDKKGDLRHFDNIEAFSEYVENMNFPLKKSGVNWFLAHAPLLDERIVKKMSDFDVLSFGHTHGGIVPRGLDEIFEKFDLHLGLISASRGILPRNARGAKILDDNTLMIINPGMTGAQFCAPRVFQNMNFIKAAEVSVVEISSNQKIPK